MPGLETMDRYQRAVMWERSRINRQGEPVYGNPPIEIFVRWNDKKRLVLQPDGSTIAYDASIVLNRILQIDSVVWLGRLDDLGDPVTPPNSGLFFVKAMDKTPDIKNRFQRFEAMLMRYKGTLPTSGT